MTDNLQILQKKPLVTVVMATFNPNIGWLAEQLASLDAQTCENLDLIICDDCSDVPVTTAFIEKYITRIPFKLLFNEKNVGSNKTFERLTLEAEGKYIAYCDQDDIWEDNKIELLVRRLEASGALLCFSDLSIIGENGEKVAISITKIRKRHVFREGENLAPDLLVRNFVTGCAMLMRTDIAKSAVPFEEDMVHDQWLALFSALNGKLAFEPAATVKYRQHGGNQTGVLTGVGTKQDYLRLRIVPLMSRIDSLKKRFRGYGEIEKHLIKVSDWAKSRKDYFLHPNFRNLKRLWVLRSCGLAPTIFEVFIPVIPRPLFKRIINILR